MNASVDRWMEGQTDIEVEIDIQICLIENFANKNLTLKSNQNICQPCVEVRCKLSFVRLPKYALS